MDSGEFSLPDIDDIKEAKVVIIDKTGTKIQKPKKVSTKRNLFRKKKTK